MGRIGLMCAEEMESMMNVNMNIERAYVTTVSADELAQAVAENFRAHDFQVQTFRTPDNATVMQARKDSLWRQAVGTAYAVTVIITPGEGQLSLRLGPHEWVDTAVSAGIGASASPRAQPGRAAVAARSRSGKPIPTRIARPFQ